MKKISFLLASFLFVTAANAQFDVPFVDYSVLNISQDNVDATVSGAHPGDVLRFEMTITSDTDVAEFIPQANLLDILPAATLTDQGLGEVQGNDLVFPTIANATAPVEEKFVFFARVKEDCGSVTSVVSQAADGGEVAVPLQNCDQSGGEGSCYGPNGCGDTLTKTGPNTVVALLSLLGVFIIGLMIGQRRRQS